MSLTEEMKRFMPMCMDAPLQACDWTDGLSSSSDVFFRHGRSLALARKYKSPPALLHLDEAEAKSVLRGYEWQRVNCPLF